jgi:predicted dehydrogenase
MHSSTSRRDFIKQGATLVAGTSLFHAGRAAGVPEAIQVALVGCGGRGGASLKNFLAAAKLLDRPVDIVALADIFPDRARALAAKYAVPENRIVTGFDAYCRVLEGPARVVLFATPPVFRPLHFAAAIEAGKHVFIEKPIAVDPPGVRAVIATGERARAKGLCVVAGTQRRFDPTYRENRAKIEAGAIGEILGGTVCWQGAVPWVAQRQAAEPKREYLVRNWLNFTEMSGDHICEQHVHNLDVANWYLGRVPVAAIGVGARLRRETGNQYDFFSVDYDYGRGVHIHSQCRQISGCYNRVGEFFRGAHGEVHGGGKLTGKAVSVPRLELESENSLVQEHVELIKGMSAEAPPNGVRPVAEATLTAIMGRISAYTGKLVRWSDLMENASSPWYNLTLRPAPADFEAAADVALPIEAAPLPGDGESIRIRV